MGDWHLWIDDEPRPGWANMAIDQTLLERSDQLGESWLRLYQWLPYCLSFGRHEPAARRYDPGRIAELGIDTVRRPTGGRAVWHAQELTYAVTAPSVGFGSLRAAYVEIHHMLAGAMISLGRPATLAPAARAPSLDTGPCFSQPVGGEILVGERKVVGSAQLRLGSALLQHGSILLHDDQDVVRGLMSGEPKPGQGIDQELWAQGPQVADAVVTAAQAFWPGDWRQISDPSQILSHASAHFQRYRSPAWTWAR